jgi:hypothetical protein
LFDKKAVQSLISQMMVYPLTEFDGKMKGGLDQVQELSVSCRQEWRRDKVGTGGEILGD